ncbi:uncharacterized protein LOC126886965 isoform X1 [Diabrotica virgifera virgifera]|uniref:U3 small nucleolar RNA-associated protein 11 n=1 Tax=Diabrotica virgifera virgifera TaxID=50390 RepID=A0ABM5KIT2_DIAVI|nr:uncharacterized protein LOC126886965 isoform X1 [Diabrotica virgifera virgifera]
MKNFMQTELEVDVQIEKALKLGENVCLVELEKEEHKRKIMRNKSKLKNREEGLVYINDYLSKNDRIVQKHVRQKAQELRKEKRKVKVGYKEIYADHEIWRWDGMNQTLVVKTNAKTKQQQ